MIIGESSTSRKETEDKEKPCKSRNATQKLRKIWFGLLPVERGCSFYEALSGIDEGNGNDVYPAEEGRDSACIMISVEKRKTGLVKDSAHSS